MSTRAHIKIMENGYTIMLYRHHDGYPEATGIDIIDAIKKVGYGDPEYLAAELVRINPGDKSPTFVPAFCKHGDESYDWFIDCNNEVVTYDVGGVSHVYYDKRSK